MSKAQFVGGTLFWDTFCAFRVCWLRGRFGGGKTALAALMAARLLGEGRVDKVVSNMPLTFSVPVQAPLENAGILLDESWMYLEGRRDVLDYAAFVRKHNHYLILPSVFSVHTRLAFFFVQRVFNGYTVGIPVWFYKWGLRDKDVKEYGYFGIYHPKAIFNHYPTKAVPGDDGGISDAIMETSKGQGYKGTRREYRRSQVEVFSGVETNSGEYTTVEETLDDFTTNMDMLLADMEAQGKKVVRASRR